MRSARRRVAAVAGVLVLLLAGCAENGDDAQTITTDGPTTTAADEAGGRRLDLTVAENSLAGLPDQIPGGVVAMTVGIEPPANPNRSLDFAKVTQGTSADEFTEGLVSLVAGGPFPESMENNAGVGAGEYSIILEPGSYFVWFERGGEEGQEEDEGNTGEQREEETPPEFVVVPLTVIEGGDGGELPETDGTITAVDYTFEVDVQAGSSFTFRNESSEQFHHANVLNFGTLDPATVEENLPAFLDAGEGESPPPPPAFAELDFEALEAGHSGVFGPGGAGTAIAAFQPGNTYAVVCFIQDRAGGPPHAFANDMYTVFQVD